MNLSLGIVFLWLGAALLYVASHGLDAASPWEVYQKIMTGLREERAPDAGSSRGGSSGSGSDRVGSGGSVSV